MTEENRIDDLALCLHGKFPELFECMKDEICARWFLNSQRDGFKRILKKSFTGSGDTPTA